MTIIIQTIKRRPSGEISTRDTRIDGNDIVLGRAPTCDVVLADLRLELEHARISIGPDGTASLLVLGTNKALVNGKSTRKTRSLKPGTIIQMGGYQLCIVAPTKAGELCLSVELLTPLRPLISAQNTDTVFGLRHALPGKRLMAWCLALSMIGFFLVLPIWAFNQNSHGEKTSFPFKADAAWSSGDLSLMHGNLENDCSVCHTDAFRSVKDQACTSCHEDLKTHASPANLRKTAPVPDGFQAQLQKISQSFGRPIDRCASCHVEHNPRVDIVVKGQKLCVSCHENLDHSLPNTSLANVSDFETGHPQFRPAIITAPDHSNPVFKRVSLDDNPSGRSGLKFSHALHLGEENAVSKQASQLGSKFGDGMDCSDCHRPESGGALFDPVNMQQDCAVCHSLTFEVGGGKNGNAYARTLRHGEPQEVIATMRDFYQAQALANIRDVEMNSSTRRRPGRAASLRDLNRRELAFIQADERTAAKVTAIFSKGGACFECHDIIRPDQQTIISDTDADAHTSLDAALGFDISPVSVNDAFYPFSAFNHKTHEIGDLNCTNCHAAKMSKTSNDILLPKIEICRDCHVSPQSKQVGNVLKQGRFPTTCLTCHSYHDGAHGEKMGGKTNQ